jgi:hypothetical protein
VLTIHLRISAFVSARLRCLCPCALPNHPLGFIGSEVVPADEPARRALNYASTFPLRLYQICYIVRQKSSSGVKP